MLKNLKFLLIIFSSEYIIRCCECSVSEDGLPHMYRMDDYRKCHEKKKTYCVYEFKITPHDPESKLGKIINESQNNLLKLDRSVLNRMICVPHAILPLPYGKRTVEREFHGENVTVDVTNLECENEYNFPYFKTFFWILFALYAIIIVLSTKHHYTKAGDPHWPKTACEKWHSTFSVIRNSQKLWENNTNLDFQRLKSIQGIRVFNTILVVFWHTVVSLFQLYIDDVDELEKNYDNFFFFYTMFLGAFCVQIYFLISTLLLTNQIYELHAKHGQYTLQHCYIFIINRIIRFLPTLLVVVSGAWIGLYDNSPHTIETRNLCIPICQQHWWFTLLQINFLLPFSQICTPGLWYLSVDTLYYIITLIILYVILKFNLNVWKFIGSTIFIMILYFGAYIYVNSYNFMFQPYPEELKNMTSSATMTYVYRTPLASWPSSLIGVILGYVYYHNKHNQHITISKEQTITWWITITCIPLLALQMSTYSYGGIVGAIIGSTLKPMFVLPLGIGILGMAFGLGGIVRAFLEMKIFIVLSNATYCTYVFHFFIVFAKGLFLTEPLHYDTNHIIFWIIFDIVSSFTLGTVCTVLIEYPGLTLQKMYIPQIRRTDKNKVNGTEVKSG